MSLRLTSLVAMSICAAGCASVSMVTNLAEPNCRGSFDGAMTAILVEQGEPVSASTRIAMDSSAVLARGTVGPRPFYVAAPSGTDYSFFVERADAGCLLRLYGRQKGFLAYTNNLTYISTRPLPPCRCE
jgi:hypothetical protein